MPNRKREIKSGNDCVRNDFVLGQELCFVYNAAHTKNKGRLIIPALGPSVY
jgi:hypothetical protein